MEIIELLENIAETKKNIDQAHHLAKNIKNYSTDLATNLNLIKSNLTKLQKLASECSDRDPVFKTILTWIETFNIELAVEQDRLKDQFGILLEKELIPEGMTLTGNFPNFYTGFFTIEVNPRKWFAKIWFGPKQELLDTCSLSAFLVASRIKYAKENLGSKIPEDSFIKILRQSYEHSAGEKIGESIQITKVLGFVSDSINKTIPDDENKMTKSNQKIYKRADFSYDLYRIQKSIGRPDLVVAVRAFTLKQEDFLWVPANENGKGSTFSHIKYQEKDHA